MSTVLRIRYIIAKERLTVLYIPDKPHTHHPKFVGPKTDGRTDDYSLAIKICWPVLKPYCTCRALKIWSLVISVFDSPDAR